MWPFRSWEFKICYISRINWWTELIFLPADTNSGKQSYFNNFWLVAFKTGRGLLDNGTLRMKWLIELIFDTLIKWVWLCRWYDFKICWISKIFKIWWNWLMSWFCAADTKSWHLKVTLIILGDETLKSAVPQWIAKLSWFFPCW